MLVNTEYEILNSSGTFVDFGGIKKETKTSGVKITLDDNKSIIVSEDHIFSANGKNMYVKSLLPNINYITTIDGDKYIKKIEHVDGGDFYDIIDSENCEYYANDILNHNCSFVGSGDNFIAEEYLRRIEEHEMTTPISQEYLDKNMWIFEEAIVGEEYIMAIDASSGHGDDFSTINMLKLQEIIEEKIITKNGKTKKHKIRRHKVEEVAEYYGKLSPQMLAEVSYQFGIRYNKAYAVVDITGGYGIQTIEKLIEYGYENVHYSEVNHKPSRDRLSGYIKKGQKKMPDGTIITVDLIPGFFIGNNRPSVLLEMQRAIHLQDIIIRSFRLLNELKTFVTIAGNRVADHKRSFHDDSIMGLAIGLYVINFDIDRLRTISKYTSEKMLDALLIANDIDEIAKKKNERLNRPRTSVDSSLNAYKEHGWLFHGLKK